MKIVIQRSLQSSVRVQDKIIGSIEKGMVLLVCLESGDSSVNIDKAIHKLINLRMFEDPATGKMSLNIGQTGGSALAISQFTLSWNGSGGHRPSFDRSLAPALAEQLFAQFCAQLSCHIPVATGRFGAEMQVTITNDGPVTFALEF